MFQLTNISLNKSFKPSLTDVEFSDLRHDSYMFERLYIENLQSWTKEMEHLCHPPPPPPHFSHAKMARFALRAPSSLLGGEGGYLFFFILSKV